MRHILTDPSYTIPPVPDAGTGVAWLRASVARFADGETHARRRKLVTDLLATIPPESLEPAGHPVESLARALHLDAPLALVQDVAQAYQPGSGDDPRADRATDALVHRLGGYDEPTAARIGILVQACQATADLAERIRDTPLEEVLRDRPPVAATKRRAPGGEIVRVPLSGDLAFGAGPHACPGRDHALALALRPVPGPTTP